MILRVTYIEYYNLGLAPQIHLGAEHAFDFLDFTISIT